MKKLFNFALKLLNYKLLNLSLYNKIIIVENSYDKSIGNELLDLRKNTQIIFSENKGYGSAVNLARKKIDRAVPIKWNSFVCFPACSVR